MLGPAHRWRPCGNAKGTVDKMPPQRLEDVQPWLGRKQHPRIINHFCPIVIKIKRRSPNAVFLCPLPTCATRFRGSVENYWG